MTLFCASGDGEQEGEGLRGRQTDTGQECWTACPAAGGGWVGLHALMAFIVTGSLRHPSFKRLLQNTKRPNAARSFAVLQGPEVLLWQEPKMAASHERRILILQMRVRRRRRFQKGSFLCFFVFLHLFSCQRTLNSRKGQKVGIQCLIESRSQ